MSIFYHEVETKRCFASAIKDVFAKCHCFRKLPSTIDSKETINDFDQEEEIFVSAIISKYMESKSRRKWSNIGVDSSCWALSPIERHGNGADEFLSAASSRLSRGSSATSYDAFVTAKTCQSQCSTLSVIEFQDFDRQRSMIAELIHCEGWPFGLCRKAWLLPPLPKSPADSWLWTKSGRILQQERESVRF